MSYSHIYDDQGNVVGGCFSEDFECYDEEVAVTIASDVDALTLARWVVSCDPSLNVAQGLYIARCIISGETWRPRVEDFKKRYGQVTKSNPYCKLVFTDTRGDQTIIMPDNQPPVPKLEMKKVYVAMATDRTGKTGPYIYDDEHVAHEHFEKYGDIYRVK